VDFTSDDTPTRYDCRYATETGVVPQPVVDVLDLVIDLAVMVTGPFAGPVDAATCAALGGLAPGAGPVTIAPGGDVYLDGELFYDCVPYEDGSPPPPDSWSLPGRPTGGGWDDGDTGLLALVGPETTTTGYPVPTDQHDVAATCGFHRAADGTVAVLGRTVTGRPGPADSATVHCRLLDAQGATVYDGTADGTLTAAVTGTSGPLSVCTEGTATWGTTNATTGFHCRYA
jgi:hypothetical protein